MLLAYIVYVVCVERTVGVPLISPVDASRLRPVGRAGSTSQEVIVPPVPVKIGDARVIPTSIVSMKVFGL